MIPSNSSQKTEVASLLYVIKDNDNIPIPEESKFESPSRSLSPEKQSLQPPKPPLKLMNFLGIREHVRENYLEYIWPKVKMENLCPNPQQGGSEIIKFTPTQAFVSSFFTPESAYKGMLLWHSVGVGKTCTAIATATSSFEKQGYTILWVTRTTLKSDIFKNMFDQVCHVGLQERLRSGMNMPSDMSSRMNLLSKSWKIQPMSYKQFSNLVSGKNALYQKLVSINGKDDPLRKTLLIIDEAHKLYGGADLSSIERPDMGKLHKSIMNSYSKSGTDSVRLLMMTATPITNDPMELIKVVNLCRDRNSQLPVEYNKFAQEFMVDEFGKFTKKGSRKFLDTIAGYVSYLSREKDARQFSQPIITQVNVPLSIGDENNDFDNIKEEYEMIKKEIANRKKLIKEECKGLKKDIRVECVKRTTDVLAELTTELASKKMNYDKVKQNAKDDFSQQGIILNKCSKKEKKKRATLS